MTTTTEDRDEGGAPQAGDRLRAKNPGEFLSQVRQEGRRVTWATRQEVMVSTVMVLIMVVAASVFFFLVDTIIRVGVGFLIPKA